jgi:hypothetical protein
MTMGGQANFHTPPWHGNVVTVDKHHTDIFSILPAQLVAADMVPEADRVGTWMFHCHIDEHMEGGMMAMYQVLPCSFLCHEQLGTYLVARWVSTEKTRL